MQDAKNRQKSPSGHHRTTLSGYIFATKARIDNRKKPVKQQYIFHMSSHVWVNISYNVAWAEAYLRTKWHLDPSSRLTTTDMGRKLRAVHAPYGGSCMDFHLTQCSLPPFHIEWHHNPYNRLATIHQPHRQDRTDNGPIA